MAEVEWGTRHQAGCYFGEGLYPQWVAMRNCTEPHPLHDTNGLPQIVLCDELCGWCGFPNRPDYLHKLTLRGQACMTGVYADVLNALEKPSHAGHRFAVARMLRFMGADIAANCMVVGCSRVRTFRGLTCKAHVNERLCDNCQFPTLPNQLRAQGNPPGEVRLLCIGCAGREDEHDGSS